MRLPETATKDGFEAQLQTNHLSHFLLSSLLLPDLKAAAAASGEARIVNHSSAARRGPPLEVRMSHPHAGCVFQYQPCCKCAAAGCL